MLTLVRFVEDWSKQNSCLYSRHLEYYFKLIVFSTYPHETGIDVVFCGSDCLWSESSLEHFDEETKD